MLCVLSSLTVPLVVDCLVWPADLVKCRSFFRVWTAIIDICIMVNRSSLQCYVLLLARKVLISC